ncbi:YHYH domain-containing protein [Hydrogenophaga sp.]|nr:YHYH domain-containing protein [Hydrogenophaga sp.]
MRNQEELKVKTIIAMSLALAASFAWAHSGGTNAQGCHNETKTGSYHCH